MNCNFLISKDLIIILHKEEKKSPKQACLLQQYCNNISFPLISNPKEY